MTVKLELRPVRDLDLPSLHNLFELPPVYQYLGDGHPPSAEVTSAWIDRSHNDSSHVEGVGLLLLEDSRLSIAGCVRTHLTEPEGTAELSYVLHPSLWGKGIATAMGWTAIERAFNGGRIDQIIAGADDPNKASIAVMERLGMRFFRKTMNAKWSGVEYIRLSSDVPPEPVPRRLHVLS